MRLPTKIIRGWGGGGGAGMRLPTKIIRGGGGAGNEATH